MVLRSVSGVFRSLPKIRRKLDFSAVAIATGPQRPRLFSVPVPLLLTCKRQISGASFAIQLGGGQLWFIDRCLGSTDFDSAISYTGLCRWSRCIRLLAIELEVSRPGSVFLPKVSTQAILLDVNRPPKNTAFLSALGWFNTRLTCVGSSYMFFFQRVNTRKLYTSRPLTTCLLH